jgi:Uri superfamily endonuclease
LRGKGLYILLIAAHGRIVVGKLGSFDFDGRYLYIGSARGPGGFKRVGRHLALAAGGNKKRRWHIDYLLAAGGLKQIWLLPDVEMSECELVQELIARGAEPIAPGFGASDSPCETHLLQVEGNPDSLINALDSSLSVDIAPIPLP